MQNQKSVTESKWTGSGLGLIGTCLAMNLLTAVTLGFGFPWAITFGIRYFTEHMMINGHRLTFDGTGKQLIGSWIKWFLLSVVTLGIYAFFVPNKICQWVTKHVRIEE